MGAFSVQTAFGAVMILFVLADGRISNCYISTVWCQYLEKCTDEIANPTLRLADDSKEKMKSYLDDFCKNLKQSNFCHSQFSRGGYCKDESILRRVESLMKNAETICNLYYQQYIDMAGTICNTNPNFKRQLIETLTRCSLTHLTEPFICSKSEAAKKCYSMWAEPTCGKKNARMFWHFFLRTETFRQTSFPYDLKFFLTYAGQCAIIITSLTINVGGEGNIARPALWAVLGNFRKALPNYSTGPSRAACELECAI
ncbi:hypothetical protein RRG08_012882 [Elysia crispata]|uniref:Secreted protein n=1 Tax=Elysia crispata TaxID=231223 RepID=A0AAE1ATU4_9GAST|nr:hypothetical protein RRG08_012882 [Elysia crispata]